LRFITQSNLKFAVLKNTKMTIHQSKKKPFEKTHKKFVSFEERENLELLRFIGN